MPLVNIKKVLLDGQNNWSSQTTIKFAGDDGFIGATERWTTFNPPTFVAAVSPATEEDVVKTIKLVRSHNIPFLATGGRHGYSPTLGKLQSGLALDLSQLNTISVDNNTDTLTIGGGTTLGQVFDPVYEAGYEMPSGTCSGPGVVGVTLGGGVGRFGGIYGLVADTLVSVRLVTANGEVVDVSETSHPDLFWAIRGAGANFGVVTSATYRLHKRKPGEGELTNIDMIFPAEMSSAYFEAMASFGIFPARLASLSVTRYDPERNQAQILANYVYLGPESEAREVMKRILDLNPPVIKVTVVPWNKLLSVHGFGFDAVVNKKGIVRVIYSANIREFSGSTYYKAFQKMNAFYAAHPDGRNSVLEFEVFPNQASAAVPNEKTAFPWRSAQAYMLAFFSWTERGGKTEEFVKELGPELREDVVATSGYSELQVIVPYAYGNETIEQIYGRNKLPRLAALKKAWDPDHVFSYLHPLPTKYPESS
ncbi:uncharacterized protein GGS25DRAFT_322188 [Hypoxylon fragiforme]|uniref:uncharacterized protein n=1 Tax=Hypoxylon fragiforme TaxID=63214 RepID=UPI0020C60A0F|nr:uncharacterized protein GGS25DRAFT_322188 [Hypoxylon fragiforme]KAI2607189.1 hypothetical protein GGS25DRAFT_322188 [Hypoxylon fragiforme]